MQTILNGISLAPLEDISSNPVINLSEISSCLPTEFVLSNETSSEVTCTHETNCISNGNKIFKVVTFSNDGYWHLKIGEKEVNLLGIGISNVYKMGVDNINMVCKEVKEIKLCCGIAINKSLICSRYHILETWKNASEDKAGKRLRSLNCNRVVSLISKSDVCRTCQKMTMGYQHKEKEEKCDANSSSSTLNQKNGNVKVQKKDFKTLIPDATDEMLELFMSQANNSGRDPRGRRWEKKILSTCLHLYTRSPHGYAALRESKILILPSQSLLILYKNSLDHKIGFNKEVFLWMFNEAIRLEIPAEGWIGGIILDEMAIQADIEITKKGDFVELAGFSNLGEEGNMCKVLTTGKRENTLGNHVLQIVFLGITGFRFPFAHFVSTQVQAPEIYSLFWDAVDQLQLYGFTVAYTSMDGAQSNRTFLHINIGKEQNKTTMLVSNPCNFDNDVVFMMDYSHVIKKVRNNILKSGLHKGCTRNLLLVDGKPIQWQMWIDSYRWDQQNGLQTHRKLTSEHLFPSIQSKMRNHLAEECLNKDMLHLFLQYQTYLGSKGSILNGAVQLLQQTSKLISIFRDKRPVTDMTDGRFEELQEVLSWFMEWKLGVMDSQDIPNKEKNKMLMSIQCIEDLESCIIGFHSLCKKLLGNEDLKIFITPALINSDVVENEFNQQRSTYNGANTNPNALQYRKALNSIILGQNSISTKANAGKSESVAESYAFKTPNPLKRKRKRTDLCSDKDKVPNVKVIRL